jgi:hypothetical protein
METNLIEKYDKSRTKILIGIAIGWSIYYGIFILNDVIHNVVVMAILNIIGLIGLALYMYGLIKMIQIKRKLKNDPVLQSALNNEWIILNRRKAYAVGFWTMLISVTLGLLLVVFINIPAKIILELILFVGIMALILTFIILNIRG